MNGCLLTSVVRAVHRETEKPLAAEAVLVERLLGRAHARLIGRRLSNRQFAVLTSGL
jgi:hypothetical protein